MRILLDQEEIQQALETYVQNMGLEGASGVELTLVGDEIQAEIIMNGVTTRPSTLTQASTETTTPDQPKRRGRLPGSKNKPKGNTNVAATSETGDDLNGSGDTDPEEEGDSDLETDNSNIPEDENVDIFGQSIDTSDEEVDGTESTESASGSKSIRGNLFGDSDSESSEDTNPDDEGSNTKPVKEPMKISGKRPSIFDAD